MNQSKNDLEKLFREFAAIGKLSKSEADEMFTNLQGAVMLNMLGRLLDTLSEESRKSLREKEIKTNDNLIAFLGTTVSSENFRQAATLSIEEVVDNFLDKIK